MSVFTGEKFEMTELERRALMGDKEAQMECTKKGIVLACPKCFKAVSVYGTELPEPAFYAPDSGGEPYKFCCECGLAFGTDHYEFKKALVEWNTRPAPPIGRCGECKFYTMLGHCKVHSAEPDQCGCGHFVEMLPTDFCSYFEPRECEE